MAKDAVFVNTVEGLTFRLGQPVTWGTAIARWYRVDDARKAGTKQRIRFNRRWYNVDSFEVRTVDQHGQGIGAERHARAIPIKYRDLRRK